MAHLKYIKFVRVSCSNSEFDRMSIKASNVDRVGNMMVDMLYKIIFFDPFATMYAKCGRIKVAHTYIYIHM